MHRGKHSVNKTWKQTCNQKDQQRQKLVLLKGKLVKLIRLIIKKEKEGERERERESERAQTNLSAEGAITTFCTDIQNILRENFKQLYANKSENLKQF